VGITIDSSFEGIDWEQAKADLSADDFDNGRTAEALRRSFCKSQHVTFARDGRRLVGMARLLSDGVCNAYLLDVWTASPYRRRGIASAMIRYLLEQVPGQHVGLQTDDAQRFYESLGFKSQPEFWSRVVGSWLDNAANR
jgi:ribosomal protein S18 acetylase RimI-like enzyme